MIKLPIFFCIVDEFCKNFDKTTKNFILGKPSRRPPTMSSSEVISILLLFQLSGFKCFKPYFLKPVVQVLVRVFLFWTTPIRVCKNKRIKANRVFKGTAQVGKSTMGWFYGFKLHLLINDRGEIINFLISQGNMDDREPLKKEGFLKKIFGKLFADKGYISQKLFEILLPMAYIWSRESVTK